jgi:hypothetical protein
VALVPEAHTRSRLVGGRAGFGAPWLDPRHRRLCSCPPIVYVSRLLTARESRYLVGLIRGRLPRTDGARMAVLTRRGRFSGDPVLRALQERLVALSGRSVRHFEPFTAVLCRKGQSLRLHWDPDEYPADLRETRQQVMSVFVNLTTLAATEGGAMVFPRLDLRIPCVRGDATCWLNVSPAGRVRRTLHHGGEVVLGDVEKWGINAWIREHPA